MEFQTEFRAPEPCPTVPNEVYLFVTNLEVHDQGTAPFPEAFWSTSALGDQCLSETNDVGMGTGNARNFAEYGWLLLVR